MYAYSKGKYIGVAGSILIHAGLLCFLLLVSFVEPEPDEELGGIPVILGYSESAYNDILSQYQDASLQPVTPMAHEGAEDVSLEDEVITQTQEQTVSITTKEEKVPQPTQRTMTEEERLERERMEHERLIAATAAQSVAGAFNKGSRMSADNAGNQGGVKGNTEGNADSGLTATTPGYGTFDLGGRSLGTGSLPIPTYDTRDEGKVVVNITVNPQGEVIATSINPQTNTVSSSLRKAAEDAAKKARFNSIDKANNQTGTITYYFQLK